MISNIIGDDEDSLMSPLAIVWVLKVIMVFGMYITSLIWYEGFVNFAFAGIAVIVASAIFSAKTPILISGAIIFVATIGILFTTAIFSVATDMFTSALVTIIMIVGSTVVFVSFIKAIQQNNLRPICIAQVIAILLLVITSTTAPPDVILIRDGVSTTTTSWTFGINPLELDKPVEFLR